MILLGNCSVLVHFCHGVYLATMMQAGSIIPTSPAGLREQKQKQFKPSPAGCKVCTLSLLFPSPCCTEGLGFLPWHFMISWAPASTCLQAWGWPLLLEVEVKVNWASQRHSPVPCHSSVPLLTLFTPEVTSLTWTQRWAQQRDMQATQETR